MTQSTLARCLLHGGHIFEPLTDIRLLDFDERGDGFFLVRVRRCMSAYDGVCFVFLAWLLSLLFYWCFFFFLDLTP
jgi:hypothetical protein